MKSLLVTAGLSIGNTPTSIQAGLINDSEHVHVNYPSEQSFINDINRLSKEFNPSEPIEIYLQPGNVRVCQVDNALRHLSSILKVTILVPPAVSNENLGQVKNYSPEKVKQLFGDIPGGSPQPVRREVIDDTFHPNFMAVNHTDPLSSLIQSTSIVASNVEPRLQQMNQAADQFAAKIQPTTFGSTGPSNVQPTTFGSTGPSNVSSRSSSVADVMKVNDPNSGQKGKQSNKSGRRRRPGIPNAVADLPPLYFLHRLLNSQSTDDQAIEEFCHAVWDYRNDVLRANRHDDELTNNASFNLWFCESALLPTRDGHPVLLTLTSGAKRNSMHIAVCDKQNQDHELISAVLWPQSMSFWTVNPVYLCNLFYRLSNYLGEKYAELMKTEGAKKVSHPPQQKQPIPPKVRDQSVAPVLEPLFGKPTVSDTLSLLPKGNNGFHVELAHPVNQFFSMNPVGKIVNIITVDGNLLGFICSLEGYSEISVMNIQPGMELCWNDGKTYVRS